MRQWATRHYRGRTVQRGTPTTAQAAHQQPVPGDAEFGFGPGLVAPHLNGRPPSEGGIYMPKCPPVHENGKQKPIPRGQARGYPGERVG